MSDYLGRDGEKAIRADIKRRKAAGALPLPDSNFRATFYKNRKNETVLTSYYTDVCSITAAGEFKKLWSGYSVTTLKHVNVFRKMHNLEALSKAAWISL